MHKSKFIGWLTGGMILAILSLSLVPASAVASPHMGFTDTPVLPPTATPEPPSGPEVVDPLITKRVDLERAQVGDLVHYTLDISNPNSVEVYKVFVVDPLPEVVDFIGTNTPQGTYNYDAGSHTLTYSIGTLAPGQTLQITITARVNSKAAAPDQFSNTAILNWGDGRTTTSSAVFVTVIPSALPATGKGPGPAEIVLMAGALLAGLAGAGLAGFALWRRLRRA